ncbi:4Fe-4S dicluster domain-containing protein [Desulfacinum infernum DSM 9756]|uniref:4Fe-4S dicluster domain-containing protein n=1 Tax=Desulfacinum infernum DSM 9756 TaxID=1121391 RepID=A0A1M4YJC0_9BACT|nr:4Fe-4S binding protein [Desulfacinum infernum]SHF05954.1 4Fe-4S dicluster domain-containing protein [Desulfacinum infernum DSM 9756]
MTDHKQVYEALATHLDRLPAGFPRTSSGVEMKILEKLFTPEEAELATKLTMKPEAVEEVAARAGMPPEELGPKLEEMAKKGLIFRLRKGDQVRYMAAQFLVGIWEYHVNSLDEELIRLMNEYIPAFFQHALQLRTPQLRTIPLPKSVTPEQHVMPYEEARKLIEEQEKIVVAPCICRKEHNMVGKGCDRPLETCLVFGSGAQYYEDNGLGRPIDKEEALKILELAEEHALVLQPSNAQKIMNICLCCGCCCQILKNLKRIPEPAKVVMSNYFAEIDRDECIGCETCVDRCQMDAIAMEDDLAQVNAARCIGCGVCVPSCPQEAITLREKTEEEKRIPPAHPLETYKMIAMERMAGLQRSS